MPSLPNGFVLDTPAPKAGSPVPDGFVLDEKYQRQVEQPWQKARAKTVDAAWERGTLLPVEVNKITGDRRWAVPQIALDIGNAVQAPGKALSGQYGMEINPETGNPSPITKEMAGDALGASGLMMPGAPMIARPLMTAAGKTIPATARNIVVRGLIEDQVPLSEVSARLRAMGPDAMVGDLGPRVQKQTAAVATMPGQGQKTVVDALTARQEAANSRIAGDVNATLGAAPIPSLEAAGIKANQRALGPQYTAAFNKSLAVDTKDIADNLDALAVNLRGPQQQAVKDVRRMLNIAGENVLDPNPETLFQTRQAIDGMMSSETNTKVLAQLSDVRKQIDAALADAVPGLKDVDARYAELARQQGALESGASILGTGKEALRPSEVVEQMVGGALPQGTMVGPSAVPFRLSQGARAEIDRLIGTKANDLLALKQAVGGAGDWNREKLAAVFGPAKADALLAIIDREMKYAETANQALAGSRTQVLKSAQDEIMGSAKKDPGVFQSIGNLQFGSAAARGADKLLGGYLSSRRAATNAAIADALTARAADTDMLQALTTEQRRLLGRNAPPAVVRALMLQQQQGNP